MSHLFNEAFLNNDKQRFWESESWVCVSYGNSKMNEWYQDHAKRRDDGKSFEFYDILSSDEYYIEINIELTDHSFTRTK